MRLLPVLLFSLLALPSQGQNRHQDINTVIRIFDERGQITPARIRVTHEDSIYLAPEGHDPEFPLTNYGGDVMLDNKRRFAYVDGEFRIALPREGKIRIEVVKGFAYRIVDRSFQGAPPSGSLDIRLEKWFEFPREAWYSGDVHVHHIDPATALLEMQAEDLNVCNVLTSDFTADQHRFRGAPEPISDSLHIVYINQEYREDRLGHVNLLNLKELIEPVKEQRKYQYPLNIEGLERARQQGGHVSWAHFAAWPGLEGPLAIVMNKVHSVELLSTIEPFSEPTFVADVIPDLRMNSGLRIWYRLLNCGLRVPATAGTDKMSNWVTVGANRVYALTGEAFTYAGWIRALEKGATFISNSPFLLCTVDGKSPGEEVQVKNGGRVKVVAEVWSQLPLDRLEIIINGEVVSEKTLEKGTTTTYGRLEVEISPQESSWIAARAHQFTEADRDRGVSFMQRRDFGGGPTMLNRYYGTLRPETAFAHTSPTYVIVDGRPQRSSDDANWFVTYLRNGIQWLDTSGKFPSEEAKAEVLNTFRKGVDLFSRLAE